VKEMLHMESWGKVLKIPRAAMSELVRAWAKENLKLVPPGDETVQGNES